MNKKYFLINVIIVLIEISNCSKIVASDLEGINLTFLNGLSSFLLDVHPLEVDPLQVYPSYPELHSSLKAFQEEYNPTESNNDDNDNNDNKSLLTKRRKGKRYSKKDLLLISKLKVNPTKPINELSQTTKDFLEKTKLNFEEFASMEAKVRNNLLKNTYGIPIIQYTPNIGDIKNDVRRFRNKGYARVSRIKNKESQRF